MTRVLHLSDLHFGRTTPGLEIPLLTTIARIDPDLVVISGDFTQRARRSQFARARAFLDRIDLPVFCVPGNHDIPLDNVLRRLTRPYARYRAAIDTDLEPVFESNNLTVVGINSANPLSWQKGRISKRSLRRTCEHFAASPGKLHMIVMHHPLETVANARKHPMPGADVAVEELADCGTDVILSGHLHMARAIPFTAEPDLLSVAAGTALSSRLRGEVNTFNLIEGNPEALRVTTWSSMPDGTGRQRFAPTRALSFRRGPSGWVQRNMKPAAGDPDWNHTPDTANRPFPRNI